ncbi:uncharacterized protein LOC134233060 [Saccostrea cucullata]|uniref:uncharacterized protein LOC134233060 n=1 Tax=Saccostrea cuccullata TaxID=36930 RepID=UPI002ED5EB55
MTMASPTNMAQEVITCDLCPKPTQQFCNNCQVSLCVDCVSKHVDKSNSKSHDIVYFTNRKIQPKFPDCKFHSNQRCEAHCQQCDVHVCFQCIFGPHNGHNVKKLQEIFNEQKMKIEFDNWEIKSNIYPEYKKKIEYTEKRISKTTREFEKLENETEKQRKQWHQEVDNIFNNLSSSIKSLSVKYLSSLNEHHRKLRKNIQDMKETFEQNKEILKTNRVSEVNNYKSKLTEYRNIPADVFIDIPSLIMTTINDKEFGLELGEYRVTLKQTTSSSLENGVSCLSTKELRDKARVIFIIPTEVIPLWEVACVGKDEVWISGEHSVIERVDTYGSQQKCEIGQCCPDDICVTKRGELIYSDSIKSTVNIVRSGRTNPMEMMTTPQGWRPFRLCCTRSGDILVSVKGNIQNKILRYEGNSGILKEEIDKDAYGFPIFEEGCNILAMAENNNGDICFCTDNTNVLIAVNKAGKVRFRYDGTPARRRKTCSFRQVVTDAVSQIILTDYINGCLHILHHNGQLLRCVDNCGLDKPFGLSLDSEGRLWVGLANSGEVRVIEYME